MYPEQKGSVAEPSQREKRAVERNKRKVRTGKVISDKMDKGIVVVVERLVRHPRYDRIVKKTTKLMAHDEDNQCRVGDRVKIMETRPLSRMKRWRLVEIMERTPET
ncbi:MAG: 30S ribosomal protein S17 [Gemmatimonadota bacterium]|nr:MAG: 30S ribosomal protein S17 [Gemmatimonadota bacterium]